MNFLLSLFAALVLIEFASAQTWYFVTFTTPAGSYISSYTGSFVAPTLPQAATYYLWPGLQPRDNAGVLQPVLDGRSGTWWIGDGWCCSNPSLPWGSGFNGTGSCVNAIRKTDWKHPIEVANGKTVQFGLKVNSIQNGTWATTLSSSGGGSATGTFPLPTHPMNQAIMAIELYDVAWTFGQFAFSNVVIVANTTSTAWCTNGPTNYQNAAVVSKSTPVATVSGGQTTCTIASIVLVRPA